MTDGEGNGYRVICVKPVKGNSITIETTRKSRKADTYKAGLAICDVKV